MDIATRISTAAAQAVGQESAQQRQPAELSSPDQTPPLAGAPQPPATGAPPPPSPLDSSQLTANERGSGLAS